ncbi:MAG: isoprenylcysteine carboxylmethyltransferase family protein [Acidobacteria bacterium]|nr:isoprenylcysteine carboxylmethyltransferase family protein [Acidobacteriota bacterium]
MELISYYATLGSFGILILTWFVFAGTFLLRKKPEAGKDAKSAPKSFAGIALQAVAFGLVWAVRRTPVFSPFVDGQFVLNVILQLVAVALALGSVWMANSAIRELGRQWSFGARLIEDHELVTSGVYRIVRHPIYAAMLGMLVATAFALSHWLVTIAAVAIFLVGTKIRTVAEEKLLREAFPDDYEKYSARVAGFVPFVRIF